MAFSFVARDLRGSGDRSNKAVEAAREPKGTRNKTQGDEPGKEETMISKRGKKARKATRKHGRK